MDIDVVIPWVNGNDPVLNAKRARYASGTDALSFQDVGGSTRYADIGEIRWCVASINRFAPWVRKIYIVTDNQNPGLGPFLDEHFPNGYIPIEIVDHTVIFRGYEQYLPSFNSSSIETMIWRIPGLSEHYLYLNDDFMLLKPIQPEDFFRPDGKIIYRGKRQSTLLCRLAVLLKPRKNSRVKVSFKRALLNSMSVAGSWNPTFLRSSHTPRAQLVSVFKEFYDKHPEAVIRNIEDKFRTTKQFISWQLQFELLRKEGRLKVLSDRGYLFYMEPRKKPHYIDRKLHKLRTRNFTCACFNSLDQASQKDKERIFALINEKLGLAKGHSAS